DPVLVELTGRRRDRVRPGQSAVGGPAGQHVDRRAADAEAGDQPDVVLGVEGDRGVAGLAVDAAAAAVGGDPGQEPVGPGAAPVGGGGPTDVGGTAAGDP